MDGDIINYIETIGNGNPLQYSCLENPRDGRAWSKRTLIDGEIDHVHGLEESI